MIWWRKKAALRPETSNANIHALPDHIKTVYAIGDAHGMINLVRKAEAAISDDQDFAPETSLILYLGDLVDRGPESAFLLDFLAVKSKTGADRMFLRGNHEAMMLRFLDDPAQHMNWLDFGGYETLNSYGIMTSVNKLRKMRNKDLVVLLQATISERHKTFMGAMVDAITSDRFFFAHAGVVPNVPLVQQTQDDLLWSRDRFMRHEDGFEKIIVHGHTPVPEAIFAKDRVSVDTGAYLTGRLSVAKISIDTESVDFIVVTEGDD
ncbi:MAG: metallophosphoesterase [Paracoccaceae bacterium]|jgi:serine/threonine protein phosphatase 1|nr:metallophosphoesterase [Paracoccaceae bacterium]